MLQPWDGATALTVQEDSPYGVVSDGERVYFTTARHQAGEQGVRSAALDPGSAAAASRILVATPGGQIPNGALALDGRDLYVAAGQGIVRVSTATGEVTPVVADRPTEVTSLAVDSRFVWWTTSTYLAPASAEVARMPKGGGGVEILAAGVDDKGAVFLRDQPARQAVAIPRASSFGSIVLDGAGAALVASPRTIYRVAPGRPHQTVVAADALGGPPTRIAADADHVYAQVAGARKNLLAVPKSGGAPQQLGPNGDDTADIAVAAGEVFFFTGGGLGGKSALRAVPTTGGAARVLASGRYKAGDLAVVGDRVVFSADSRVSSAYRQRP